MTEEHAAAKAEGLRYAYGDRIALRGIDFEIPAGTVHGFLGPNGSGKSTLFKILATILPIGDGKASLLGLDLATRMPEIRRKIGVVFQSPALDRKLSIRRNLIYGGQMFGLGGSELSKKVEAMLEYANLRERQNEVVGELSGGLRRRVELAKGMLHDPELLLLDEPSTGLDPGARRDLWEFLRAREGLSVLFTTHLMDEAELADRLTILHEGAIVGEGTANELKDAIGGEVLEIGARESPEALAAAMREVHGVTATVADGTIRVESEDAPALVPLLMKEHGDAVQRVTLSRPSLDDVFLQRTGRRFVVAGTESAEPESKRRRRRG